MGLMKLFDSSENVSTDSIDSNKRTILEGKIGEDVGLSSRIVRVFLSSTFTDMCHERNALMENVYPQLKQYCKENYGVEFQVVDMRWGVHKDAYNDHMVIDLCLKEIENCQRLSVGPNFVVLIGQKYGFRPLPSTVLYTEFDNLLYANHIATHHTQSNTQSNTQENDKDLKDITENETNDFDNNNIRNNKSSDSQSTWYVHVKSSDGNTVHNELCNGDDSKEDMTHDLNNERKSSELEHGDENDRVETQVIENGSDKSKSPLMDIVEASGEITIDVLTEAPPPNQKLNNESGESGGANNAVNEAQNTIDENKMLNEIDVAKLETENELKHNDTDKAETDNIQSNDSSKLLSDSNSNIVESHSAGKPKPNKPKPFLRTRSQSQSKFEEIVNQTNRDTNKSEKTIEEENRYLHVWYKLDENSRIPVYCLQPIHSVLATKENCTASGEVDKQKVVAAWKIECEKLKGIMRERAKIIYEKGLLSEEDYKKYYISVTEDEISHGILGILKQSEKNLKSLSVFRTISKMTENLSDENSPNYIDMIGKESINDEAQNLLNDLKDRVETSLKEKSAIIKFDIQWKEGDSVDKQLHEEYLQQFCASFMEKLRDLIDRSMAEKSGIREDTLLTEVLQHAETRKTWSNIVIGRNEAIHKMRMYTIGRTNQPMVVFGESGSGKTALMAKAAQLAIEWKPNAMVVYRFLGTTPKTSTVGALVRSLCHQLSVLYGKSQALVPSEYIQLIPHFHQMLKLATKDKPLVIILDSLDQLSRENNAHRLLWLPMKLPTNVKLIVSAIPTFHHLGDTIRETIKADTNILEIEPLGEEASLEVIMAKLYEIDRTITKTQQDHLTGLFQKCSLPLFCKLTFENVRFWKSYYEYDKTYAASDVESAVTNYFERLEAKHGLILISRYLAYLTAAKNGLSDVELEDILSLDDAVLNEVFFFWIPPIRRIPPSILTHIKVDLRSYVITREANNVHVNSWYHRRFAEVATKKYLHDNETRELIHSNLADYFMGTWGGGACKPFEYSVKQISHLNLQTHSGTADRKAPLQPLMFESQFGTTNIYNLRKLDEMPRNLILSKRVDELLKHVVFNYRWLHTILSAMNIRLLRKDLHSACDLLPDNESLQYLCSVIRQSCSALQKNPDSLAPEIMCRLLWYYDTHPELQDLIQQCEDEGISESVLVPVDAALDPPTDALIYSLEGHSSSVTDIELSKNDRELFSVSRDGSICQWDMRTSEILKRIDIGEIDEGRPADIKLSKDDTYIVVSHICDGIKHLSVYLTKTGDLINKWPSQKSHSLNNDVITTNYAVLDGKVLYLQTCSTLRDLQEYEKFKYYVIVDIVPNEQFILLGLVNETVMYDIETCAKIVSLPSDNISSCMILTIDNTTAIVSYSIDCLVKCFDIDPVSQNFGKAYHTFSMEESFPDKTFETSGNFTNEVSEIAISRGESMLVSVVRRRYPAVWNLITGEGICLSVPEQEIPEMFFWISFTHNAKYIAAISSMSKIYVWSVETGDVLTTHIAHNNNTKELLCGLTQNIAASIAVCENMIKIWDIEKLVEHHQTSSSVNKNIKAIVLPPAAETKAFLISAYPHGNSFYRYINYFTLEMMDLITRKRTCIMPFDKYGNCCQLVSNADGSVITYMVNNMTNRQFSVIDLKSGELVLSRSMPGCCNIKMSDCGLYIVCIVKKEKKLVTRLFDCKANKKIITLRHSDDAAFLTPQNLLYLTNNDLQLFDSTTKNSTKWSCKFSSGITDGTLHVIKAKNVVLVTSITQSIKSYTNRCCYVVDLTTQTISCTIKGLSKTGITAIADTGEVIVDSEIQIFEVSTGKLIHDFNAESGTGGAKMIQLSPGGRYVIWQEKHIPDTIKVARISTGQVFASCNLHSNINSLAMHGTSDIVTLGTNEGHFHLFRINDNPVKRAEKETSSDEINRYSVDSVELETLQERKTKLLSDLKHEEEEYIRPVKEAVIQDLMRIYRVSNIKHLELEETVEERGNRQSRICTIS